MHVTFSIHRNYEETKQYRYKSFSIKLLCLFTVRMNNLII